MPMPMPHARHRRPTRRRPLPALAALLALAGCGGSDSTGEAAPVAASLQRQVHIAAVTAAATAPAQAGATGTRYESATGMLWLPGITVGTGAVATCYDASLRTISAAPIALELASATAIDCAGAQAASGRYDGAAGTLALSRLPVVSDASTTCYDVALHRSSAEPLRLVVDAATEVPCTVTTPPASATFALTSPVGTEGGTLAADYSCDGPGASPALAWSGAPAATREYALLMTTLPGDGSIKYNWVLHSLPATVTSLKKDNFATGTPGVGSDGPFPGYQPPCSQGPGAKRYTFTVYALSGSPVLPAGSSPISGAALAQAIAPLTLATATLNLSYTRTTMTGSSTACLNVRNSLSASTTGRATVSCDANYAYVGSTGLAGHTMMDGITATNLQVPTAQNFLGANAWKIPLAPAIAATTTTAVDGPIGIAINGVPIFNPCKQGGCQNGDTKVQGELDVCNGHAGRADDYHYHAAPVCLMAGKAASYWDTHPLGWALDGFAIFGYHAPDGTPAPRDAICGGNTSTAVAGAPSAYAYHVTDASPYVLSCFRGTPSPDLAGQGAKFSPMRQPPVTPFPVSAMTLTTDADGWQVLQFSSGRSFTTTETGSDAYANAPGTYRIRYKPVTGAALAALLGQAKFNGKSACWSFQFTDAAGKATQPETAYCR